MDSEDQEFQTLQEAAAAAQVSRFTVWRLIRDGKLAAYRSQRDRREKLVRVSELKDLLAPRPIPPAPKKGR